MKNLWLWELKQMRDHFLQTIDWALLREQKQWLMSQENDYAEGLLAFIDSIQDYAVDNFLVQEETVFGKEYDNA